MKTILDTICATKREEVAALRRTGIAADRTDTPRGFLAALKNREPIGLIAEIKKASPSKGIIREQFDPRTIAAAYARGGAHCLSVLTDRVYFQGDNSFVAMARTTCSLPVLRKEFIFHPIQIEESFAIGADALLLIVAMLDPAQLEDLFLNARSCGLDVLVEVHDEREMERALALRAPLVGINNRNLHDFSVSLETTARVAKLATPDMTLVSESGIFSRADIDQVKHVGAAAVLVGESLMRQDNIEAAVRTLLNGQ